MKGKAEGTTLKGKVHQWAGVGGTGKATVEENEHPLHHTMEAYGKEGGRKPLVEKKEEVKEEQEFQERTCSNQGRYCGVHRQDKGKGSNIDWGPTSILPGTAFQMLERQTRRKRRRDPIYAWRSECGRLEEEAE